jgi:hypothetical protein
MHELLSPLSKVTVPGSRLSISAVTALFGKQLPNDKGGRSKSLTLSTFSAVFSKQSCTTPHFKTESRLRRVGLGEPMRNDMHYCHVLSQNVTFQSRSSGLDYPGVSPTG